MERTFGIIKPDAVEAGHTGAIIDRIEKDGFIIKAIKKIHMSKEQARKFYDVHNDKPFFDDLVDFTSSAPCVIFVLERNDAIRLWRQLMGATDPKVAIEGTIRNTFGKSIGRNAVHGSDSPDNAASEIAYFFSGIELV